MARQRKLSQDKRLDWRDPDMPVIRKVLIDNKPAVVEILPKKIEEYYFNKIFGAAYDAPTYRNDPSYWWRKKK